MCLVGTEAGFARAADCSVSLSGFEQAMRSGMIDQASRSVAAVFDNCPTTSYENARDTLVATVLRRAAGLQSDQARRAEYRQLLETAARYRVSWEVSWRLADVHLIERQYKLAAIGYQQAIELLAPRIETSEPDPKLTQYGRYLLTRADEARMLAAATPTSGEEASFVAALPDHRSGGLGGVYSASLGRGIEATKVPPPITFKFDSAEFTSVGTQAANELVELLKQRSPSLITVTGHTDQRGTDAYNLELSRRRADAVGRYLAANGVKSRLTITGKGKTEPRVLSDPSVYSQDQVEQLNRRVELDWSN